MATAKSGAEPPNLALADLLDSAGFPAGEPASRARLLLEEAGLTNARKKRIALDKEPRARQLLAERLAPLCSHPICAQQTNGREIVLVHKTSCEACGGSSQRRMAREAGLALRAAGLRHILILGGTKQTYQPLQAWLEPEGLALRWVDGTAGSRRPPTVAADLEWADIMVVWATTPLPHRVSTPYTDRAPARLRVITVARRGVESVCQELVRSVRSG